MKRNIHLHFVVLLCAALLASCSGDEPDSGIVWDADARIAIRDGIDASADDFCTVLNFRLQGLSEVVASSDCTWLSSEIRYGEPMQLVVYAAPNDAARATERTGTLSVVAGGEFTQICVRQAAPLQAADLSGFGGYRQEASGGEMTASVWANGDLTVTIYPADAVWLRVVRIEPDEQEHHWLVRLAFDPNDGLGRIASLRFRVDGNEPQRQISPCLVQDPGPFSEELTVVTEQAGMLPVLLGMDRNNLSRIRSLRIEGPINGLDWQVLNLLGRSKPDESPETCPIRIDLSEALVRSGNTHPFAAYNWSSILPDFTEAEAESFPSGVFTMATNLEAIQLPRQLRSIRSMAFTGCTALREIEIPDAVETIGSNAFSRCTGLEQITISPTQSVLYELGDFAFSTGTQLRDLSLPVTLRVADAALLFHAERLHVQWPEPPAVKLLPQTSGCTLCVPEGAGERYRQDPQWGQFEQIVEEHIADER